MPQPQASIIPDPSPNALFLILRVRKLALRSRTVAKVAAGSGAAFFIPSLEVLNLHGSR